MKRIFSQEHFYPHTTMDDPIGATPLDKTTNGEFSVYWSINYSKYIVELARKIVERELFHLPELTYSEKVGRIERYKRELHTALLEHYSK